MAVIVPTVAWQTVACPGVYEWSIGQQGGQPATQITGLTHGAATRVTFSVGVSGAFSTAITGTTTLNSRTISSLSSVADLVAGQAVSAANVPPNSVIESVGGSSLVFANGPFDEDTNSWADPIGATAAGSGVLLTINDPAPIGALVAAVTPSTGITITDTNSDDSGNVSHTGNGSAIANLIGEAEGGFAVFFASAGTFTVSCAYSTTDPNYTSVALSPPIVCGVS